eukprot:761459-Hanusia_phi.AAC.4
MRPKSAETVSAETMEHDAAADRCCQVQGVPEDCFVHVFKFFNAPQLCFMARVCRDFRRLSQADMFWKKICISEYCDDVATMEDTFACMLKDASPTYWKSMFKALLNSRIELQFTAGPRQGDSQVIDTSGGPCLLGRSRYNHVCILHDEMVSRKHAIIVRSNNRYWIRDVGGINRTFINKRVIVQHTDYALRINDQVEMGSSTFIIRLVRSDADVQARSKAEDRQQRETMATGEQ